MACGIAIILLVHMKDCLHFQLMGGGVGCESRTHLTSSSLISLSFGPNA